MQLRPGEGTVVDVLARNFSPYPSKTPPVKTGIFVDLFMGSILGLVLLEGCD